MNWDQIEGNWKEMKGKARASWGELTDDELTQIGGKKDQLVGKVQQKYGVAREEAERRVDDWANDL
ncbi:MULTISPECIES: CsbD family protein [Vreelandella]|uniref:CsbD family protein n=2 Tax=Vreelandella TaxID=3137766 RepID=A0A7C9JTU4_9GAMM|nr:MULTISPECIES: CsbD family protein [Halomonas]NDL71183.1 CsbD family protein [Halomonas alkaliphila]NYS44954.1 CsbD family protein [Halomonas zhaodongensis]